MSGAVLAALLLVSAVGVTAVFAQEPEPEAEPKAPFMHRFGGMRGFGRGGFGRGMHGEQAGEPWTRFDGLAEALGLTPEELFAELHDGKTLEEIAGAQGVDLDAVKERMAAEAEAERVEAMRDAIAQAVEDGEMSDEQAQWLLEGLDKGYMPGFRLGARGFGRGWGPCAPADVDAETATQTTSA